MRVDVMPTLSQFEAIFHSSPRLSHLAIFGWGPIFDNSRTIPNAGHLRLQYLQRLSFGFLDIPYSLQLLSLFDFPSLSELVLEDISRVVNPSDLQDGSSFIQWLSSTPSSLAAPFDRRTDFPCISFASSKYITYGAANQRSLHFSTD